MTWTSCGRSLNKRSRELEKTKAVAPTEINLEDFLPKPQPGGQTKFYNSEADITVFGGAMGSGKSIALLTIAARDINTPGYGAVVFRRTSPEITNEGGLWDESNKIYTDIPGARGRESDLDWLFSSGSAISFGHCQYEKDAKEKYKGAQVAFLGFDELTGFTENQFWFLYGRNRSTCGVKPRTAATTNPDADSWVKPLIQWWIDEISGYAIKERAGILRWFYRIAGILHWGDSREEMEERFPEMAAVAPPISLTFIPGTVFENKKLLEVNPQYLSNLLAMPPVERERYLYGNWNIKHDIKNRVMYAFDEKRHIGAVTYDPKLPLCVSFDFNVNPATAIIGQRQNKNIVIFEEVYLKDSNTFESSTSVRLRIQNHYNPYIVYLFGDASGKNKSANSQQSNWSIVENAMLGARVPFSSQYPKANPPIIDTLNSANHLFMNDRVMVAPNCTELIRDFLLCVGDGKGGIDKKDGARTHLLDCARYLLHTEFPYR